MHEIESQNTTFLQATKEKTVFFLRVVAHAIKAQGLNLSVLYLELRLWYARRQINGMLGAIEDAQENMREACKKDADRAFESAKREASVSSLGLSKVITNALENGGIHDLKKLDSIMYDLESIPGIGPSRAETIRQAFAKSLRKAAIKSGRTLLMVELMKRHVLFRHSVTSTMARLSTAREKLSIRADEYNAVMDDYCVDADYREESGKSKEKLWEAADGFLQDLDACRRKAFAGQMPGPPAEITAEIMDSHVDREWRGMTFVFSLGLFKQVNVRCGSIVR